MVPFSLYPSQEYSCGMAFRKPNQIPLCGYGSISIIPTNTIFPFLGWWTSINPSCSDVGTGWCSPSPDKFLDLFRNGGMFQVCIIYIYIYLHTLCIYVCIYIYTYICTICDIWHLYIYTFYTHSIHIYIIKIKVLYVNGQDDDPTWTFGIFCSLLFFSP